MYVVELSKIKETDNESDELERYNHLIQNLYHKPESGLIVYGSSKRNNLIDKVVNNGLLTSEQIITTLEDDNISNKIQNLILDNQKYIVSVDELDNIPLRLEYLYSSSIIVHVT